jgi:Protein of unknown function (DUF1612)/HTH DNA binding domain
MTPDQVRLVQESFRDVAPIREVAAATFYERLFAIDPTLRALFSSTNMAKQGVKLMVSLGFVVQGLYRAETILPNVRALARRHVSAVLAAAIAWDAWETIEPLQHQHWLGNLLVAALLRERGKVASHLFALNTGLRLSAREKRKSPVRSTRLLAFLDTMAEGASLGFKEIDRLAMAKGQMERRLRTKRKTSSLPALVELVLARPVVSAGLIAAELKVSQRAALDLIAELGIREITGRGATGRGDWCELVTGCGSGDCYNQNI